MRASELKTLSPLLNVMIKAARGASRQLIRDFGEVAHLQVSKKGPADFVSSADKQAEKYLYEDLKHARPKFGFLMEESGLIKGEEDTFWVIDPLDGTSNFLHNFPHFCMSIGVISKGEAMAGLIYDPIKDEMFFAEKGGGPF